MENKTQYVGALWLKELNDGRKFFSGTFEYEGKKIPIAIFRNDRKKEGSNQPDYNIVLSQQRKKQEEKKEFADDIPF